MPLTLALRASQNPEEALVREGTGHAWDNLQEKVDSETPPETTADTEEVGEGQKAPTEDDDPLYRVKFMVEVPGKEGQEAAMKETTLAELPVDSKEQLRAMIDNTRAQTHAALQLTPWKLRKGPARRRGCWTRCGRVPAAS